jgi:hypothetical protein
MFTCLGVEPGNCWAPFHHGDQPISGDRHPIAKVATFEETEVLALGDFLDTVFPVVAAHGFGIGLSHQPDEAADPWNGVIARVVRNRQMAARLQNSGDLAEREFSREVMQRLCGRDDIEVAGKEGQRLDAAYDVPPTTETGGQTSNPVDGAIDAEHLVAGIGKQAGETAATGSEIKDAYGFRTDHPGDRRFRIGIPLRSHARNFSGAGPAS